MITAALTLSAYTEDIAETGSKQPTVIKDILRSLTRSELMVTTSLANIPG